MLITSSGVHLEVTRIDRRVLDAFQRQHPLPIPPEKEITLYGGFKDTVPDEDDPGYQNELIKYTLAFAEDQIAVISDGIEILDSFDSFAHYRELVALDIILPDDKQEFLRHVALATDADIAMVIDAILYLSTVTEQGIAETQAQFVVTWSGLDLSNVHVPRSPARFSRYYEDREAAQWANYTWQKFIELTGPEQSAVVAHYRTAQRLAYLIQDWSMKRSGK